MAAIPVSATEQPHTTTITITQLVPGSVFCTLPQVLEIKRLTTAIAALRSEMNKYEEQLEDCRKYKDFLDAITPPEWFEAQATKLQRRKDAMLAEWQASSVDIVSRLQGCYWGCHGGYHRFTNGAC